MWWSSMGNLSEPQRQDNANEIMTALVEAGWSMNAAVAVIANFQGESGINPGMWEGAYVLAPVMQEQGITNPADAWHWLWLNDWETWASIAYPPTGAGRDWYREPGMGLAGWTPYTKVSGISDGDYQMRYFIGEFNSAWDASRAGGMAAAAFKQSYLSPDYLAELFCLAYERPAAPNIVIPYRREWALKWAKFFGVLPIPFFLLRRKKRPITII